MGEDGGEDGVKDEMEWGLDEVENGGRIGDEGGITVGMKWGREVE